MTKAELRTIIRALTDQLAVYHEQDDDYEARYKNHVRQLNSERERHTQRLRVANEQMEFWKKRAETPKDRATLLDIIDQLRARLEE